MKKNTGGRVLNYDFINLTSALVALNTLYGSLPFSLLRNAALTGLSIMNYLTISYFFSRLFYFFYHPLKTLRVPTRSSSEDDSSSSLVTSPLQAKSEWMKVMSEPEESLSSSSESS